MSSVSFNTLSSSLIWIDRFSEKIPLLSTVTNIFNIVQKASMACCCERPCSDYHAYLIDKSAWRCVVLLVPILGNLVIAAYDYFVNSYTKAPKQQQEKSRTLDNLDKKIVVLSTRIQELEKLEQKKPEMPQRLTFKKLNFDKAHEQIWIDARIIFEEIVPTSAQVQAKVIKVNSLIEALFSKRKAYYLNQLSKLDTDILLQEAKERYVLSFLIREQKDKRTEIQDVTLETLKPILEARKSMIDKYKALEISCILEKI